LTEKDWGDIIRWVLPEAKADGLMKDLKKKDAIVAKLATLEREWTTGLRTIELILYCRILNMQYNILQYFRWTIQYIAILQIDNTIYCNTLIEQYNILQYFRTPIQYIAILLLLQYIVLVTIYCNIL
jgi:hypothetical protein